MHDLLFLDVETTGLTPSEHSVLSVGAIRTDSTGAHVKTVLNLKVKPTTAVDPGAARVNGYTEEKWADAVEPTEAAAALASIAQGAQIVGHCIWFDESFCRPLLEAHGQKVPWSRNWIDTQSLAQVLKARHADLKSASLQAVCDVLGWSRNKEHEALEDAELARQLFLHVRGLVAEGGVVVESMAAPAAAV